MTADTPKPDRDQPIADHAGGEAAVDAIRHGDVAALVRHLLATGDPMFVEAAALFDPDPKASAQYKLELKRRHRGRPRRNTQNPTAEKVRATAAAGAKVESQIADLEKNGVSRSTALRYRKLLGLSAKK